MKHRTFVAAALLAAASAVAAQTPLKVGVIVEMTGPQAEYGLQMTNGIKQLLHERGNTVAGRKIELIVKDVGGPNPELAKRHAQELIVREKVEFLAGFGFSPNALAVAPLATEAKVPMIVMNAATSIIPRRSPYIARVSFTLAQHAAGIADWAAKQGVKSVFTLYADYSPGRDANAAFKKIFSDAGGRIVGEIGVPLQNPDFGPYMQRVRDAKPDALFMWFPSGELANGLLRAYRARGLEAAGIRPLGTSDLVDDMFVDAMGDAAIGLITSAHYSVAHDSPKNKAFLALHRQLYGDKHRPNFMAVAGYDGMALIHDVVKQLGGKIDGDKAMAIIKGAKLDSPRGPITIDPVERDVIQNMYIRKTERRNGELYNIEFATLPDMKDPGKDIAN